MEKPISLVEMDQNRLFINNSYIIYQFAILGAFRGSIFVVPVPVSTSYQHGLRNNL